MSLDRPTFLASAGGVVGGLALGTMGSAGAVTGTIPQRRLGRTNEMVSIIAMGGFHIGKPKLSDDQATALIHEGVDRGITFLDNCWDYNDGTSEMRMGKALAMNGYRDRVFLMTKIDGRTAAAFNEQLEQSLTRLKTDHVDLLQIHENIRPDDAERVFAKGGAMEAMIAAKKAGKTRFIGFTGHKSPQYHLHMIEVAQQHGFTFDTVQMPINVMDAHFRSFEQAVLPVAKRLDMGVIAMKTFGDPFIYQTKLVDPIAMLHYGMTVSPGIVVTGIDSTEILDQAVQAATTFVPLSADQRSAILAKTAAIAASGATEKYKTTHVFDGTINNPVWLG